LRDRSFEINLTLIAGQGRDFFPAGDQFRKDFRRLKLKAQLLGLAPFDIQSAPALIAPVERPHQLPRPTLAITKAKPFLDQDANRFDGPSAARLSAWHRFLLKQLTELVQFLRLQVTLAMLPSPARIILQAVQASLLVGLRPATDRLFIHKEDVGGLPITIAFGHEQQRMVALPLMSIEFLVFVPSRSFQEVWLAQHCASFFRKRCSTRRLYSVSAGSISWCAGHIGLSLHRAGKIKDARQAFGKSLSLRPDFAPAYTAMAFMHLLGDNNKEAAKNAEKALALDPKSFESLYITRVVRLRERAAAEALARANDALKIKPDYPLALILKTQALVNMFAQERAKLIKSPERDEASKSSGDDNGEAKRRPKYSFLKEASESLEAYLKLRPEQSEQLLWREQLEALRIYARMASDSNSGNSVTAMTATLRPTI